jgi:excisionase family DNA binding protein
MSKSILTLAEAAKELGLATVTLRVQVYRQKLKATKYGTTWTVTRREVDRYRRQHLGRASTAA